MAGNAQPLRSGDPEQLGPYRIVGRLGEGGMGSVFLAQPPEGRPVALKVIRADLAREPEFRRRFSLEVARARQVPPFCTAEVLDADPDHDTPYLVVEYVAGPSLAAVIGEHGPLTPSNLHGLAIGVATALTAIHGAGVIHRDLKPGNVLLAPGSPKVIDFGIARAVDVTQSLTRPDQVVGSVSYMAPERFGPEGGGVTQAADVFAWGAVVAYAGTGRLPFAGDSMPGTVAMIMTQAPDLAGLSGPLRDLVEDALAKEPKDRPTARQLVDRLLAGGPTRALNLEKLIVQDPVTGGVSVSDTVGGGGASGSGTAGEGARGGAGLPGAVSDSDTTRVKPAAPEPTRPAPNLSAPSPRGGGGLNLVLRGILALSMLVLAAAVVGVITGVIDLPKGGPTAVSDVSGTPGPSATPSGPVPAGATLFLRDPLSAEGPWKSRDETATLKATCTLRDGMLVAERRAPGSYRCLGRSDYTIANVSVFVDVTILEPGSCAGLWFRFSNESGYALRVCQDKVQLVTHGKPEGSSVNVMRGYPLTSPLAPGTKARIGIVTKGSSLRFFRDGVEVGSYTSSTFTEGRVILGLFQTEAEPVPVSRVGFADIEIWEG
ncbi:serine/threonine-protein kinase [Longispora sp. NPDC051575]|uniref:serine/threonine protein kinase n=1 Tax=Longispora sp. NPDC051575 TaxID=3154943 RepID=UPI00341D9C07